MRAGTAYVANASPEVFIAFFNINPAGGIGSQVGANYVNYATGGTERRLTRLELTIEPYTGIGVCHLLNQDQALNALDFRGCIAAISWNWHGGVASNEEYFWVTSQRKISAEGKLYFELQLANAWEMLQHSKGVNVAVAAAFTNPVTGTNRLWPRTTTVHNILAAIIGDVNGFLGQWGLTGLTVLGAEPAGAFAIQTYQPFVVSRIGEDDRALMRRLLQMTESAITFRQATGATQNYINPALPGPYFIFDLTGAHEPFFAHVNGSALTMPNRVIVADLEPDPSKSVVANFVGDATDVTSLNIGAMPDIFYDSTVGFPHATPPTAPEIAAGNAEAVARAQKLLARKIAEANLGEVYVPMNCTAELYDEIQITDSISGQTVIGRIGRIERKFIAVAQGESFQQQRESYSCRIHLGGIGGGSLRTKSYTGYNDIDASALDMKSRGLHNPFVDSPQLDASVLSQHYAPQLETRPGTAGNQASTGAYVVLTGMSITTPVVPIIHEARVNICVKFFGNPGVAGDIVRVQPFLDGVGWGEFITWTLPAAGDQITLERTFTIPIPADGLTHIIDARYTQTAGAGANSVTRGESRITVEIFSGINSRLF